MRAIKTEKYVYVPFLPELSHLLLNWLIDNRRMVFAVLTKVKRDGIRYIKVAGLPIGHDDILVEYINSTIL